MSFFQNAMLVDGLSLLLQMFILNTITRDDYAEGKNRSTLDTQKLIKKALKLVPVQNLKSCNSLVFTFISTDACMSIDIDLTFNSAYRKSLAHYVKDCENFSSLKIMVP